MKVKHGSSGENTLHAESAGAGSPENTWDRIHMPGAITAHVALSGPPLEKRANHRFGSDGYVVLPPP